jgi:hypothetical protein
LLFLFFILIIAHILYPLSFNASKMTVATTSSSSKKNHALIV